MPMPMPMPIIDKSSLLLPLLLRRLAALMAGEGPMAILFIFSMVSELEEVEPVTRVFTVSVL
jgi:hypothetical protein